MRRREYLRAALAAMAAAAGTGFASGRELTLFFAQLGRAAWPGILFASAVFGALVALVCRGAARIGADSFALLCRRLLPRRTGGIALALYGLLLSATALAMACGAGRIGALTLPVRHGWLAGAALALLIALVLNLSRLRALPWAGLAVLLVAVGFYAALALDPRPVRVYLRGDVRLALEDSVPAALLLALPYGAMNACLAAAAAAKFGRKAPAGRVGALCGGMLCAVLLCADAAMRRGGRTLLGQALPTVLLSARWGLTGFWICAGFTFFCVTLTLSAALGGLVGLAAVRHRRERC